MNQHFPSINAGFIAIKNTDTVVCVLKVGVDFWLIGTAHSFVSRGRERGIVVWRPLLHLGIAARRQHLHSNARSLFLLSNFKLSIAYGLSRYLHDLPEVVIVCFIFCEFHHTAQIKAFLYLAVGSVALFQEFYHLVVGHFHS